MRNKYLGTGRAGFHPFKKVKTWISGLRYAVIHDFAVTYKIFLSTIVLAFCVFYHEWINLLLIVVATGMMIISEMFNTAIEAVCDMIQPNHDERIKIIKDISAAAASMSILVWLVVIAVEARYFFKYTWGY